MNASSFTSNQQKPKNSLESAKAKMTRLFGSLFLTTACLAILLASVVSAKEDHDGQKASIKVEHSVDGETWKLRGHISYRASTAFAALDSKLAQIHSTIEQEKISARFVANLENLAAKNALYRVRISSGSNSFVSASVPACQLLGSSFTDELTVHMTSSKVVGVSYHISSTNCAKTSPVEKPEFQTQVRVKMADEGPRPNLDPTGTGRPTATASSPAAPTEPEAEPGFFQKYWHYLLPIPILLILTGICAGEEEKPSGRGSAAKK